MTTLTIAYLRPIYGDSIDYGSIRIQQGGSFESLANSNNATTILNEIHMPNHVGRDDDPVFNSDGSLTEEGMQLLGHEVAHVYNGDMVTMGLIQGVLNTFVIIFSRLLGGLIDQTLRGNRGGGGSRYSIGYFIGNMIGNVVFGMLASFIAAWFSRQREYRADAGGADLAGRQNMIGALQALQRGSESALPSTLQAFGIAGGGKLAALTATHPPLEVRIARLQADGQSVKG
ncbi:MAG: M48 family metalloprotease [Methylococcales bacterium]|nr:M48 family metalloprotease [Methylococcales bacterium]